MALDSLVSPLRAPIHCHLAARRDSESNRIPCSRLRPVLGLLCVATFLAPTGVTGQVLSILDLAASGTPYRPDTYLEAHQPTLDGRLPFRGESDDGDELWWTDGTAIGTEAEDLASGVADAAPDDFVAANGRIFFSAVSPGLGRELWVTDGPGMSSLVADLETGVEGSHPQSLTAFGDDLYFVATVGGVRTLYTLDSTLGLTPLGLGVVEPASGTRIVDDDGRVYFEGAALPGGHAEIWASDGADGVTEAVTDLACPDWGELFGASTFVFVVCDLGTQTNLYRLDPMLTGGVSLVHSFGDTTVEQLTAAGGTLYMVVGDSEIWGYDPNMGLTSQVTSFGSPAGPEQLLRFQGDLLFTATVSGSGRELYRADGSTVTLIEIRDGLQGSDPTGLRLHDGLVYFAADDGEHGDELWVTDGTVAGTEMVVDLELGADGSGIVVGPSTPFGLVFRPGRWGLWVTDGTMGGTVEVDFPDTLATWPEELLADPASGRIFFERDRGRGIGREPAMTDGTVAGTVDLGDLAPGDASSAPVFLATLPNGRTLFSADDGTNHRQLWSTQGVADDAELVEVIPPGGLLSVSGVVFGDFFYFCADDAVHWSELWRSDGTAAGTELFADIHPTIGSNPCDQAIFGSHLYFGATDGVGGGLWRTDGTPAGTELVAPTGTDRPHDLMVYDGNLYFSLFDAGFGYELWRSDGSPGGTNLFVDLVSGTDDSNPGDWVIAGGLLYFSADDEDGDQELWRTDGTVGGTFRVFDPGPGGSSLDLLDEVGGGLVFESADQLYFTDGTPDAATLLLAPDVLSVYPWSRARFGEHLYFVAGENGYASRDLWRTDGTIAGTENLQLEPGAVGSAPTYFAATSDRLYFQAWDADAKSEIHILEMPLFSDGFESGDVGAWSP